MESAPARAQSRILPFRLSKTPSQPARDKGCGTQSPDTHNAACGIETGYEDGCTVKEALSRHT